jgi:hypothetical protein
MSSNFDILCPEDVISMMPASVQKSWVYDHWEDLGGVRIGKRLFILREVLYANLQTTRVVVREGRMGRRKMDTQESGNGANKVEKKARGQARGSGVKAARKKVKNHSNEFGRKG